MRLKSFVENQLFRILPGNIFNRLVFSYQTVKHYSRHVIFHIKTNLNSLYKYNGTVKITVLDLDTHAWTKADILRHLEESFPKNVLVLKHGLSWKEYETGFDQTIVVTRENYHTLTHEGLLLWELTKVSIIKHIGKLVLPGKTLLEDEDLHYIRQYYSWAVKCHDLINKRLEQYKPDIVFLTQGGIYDSRIFSEVAKQKNIPVVAVENSFSSRHFYIDNLSGQILNRHGLALIGSFVNECRPQDYSTIQKDVYEFFGQALKSKEIDHRTDSNSDPSKTRESLSIPKGKKVILFLGQVRTDASIILDSVLYPDPVSLIEALIQIVDKNDDYFLVIRLHPKEAIVAESFAPRALRELCHNATLNELASRGIENSAKVRIVADRAIDTYALMDAASVGVTINSQSGLEMALKGLPVITAGRCFYAGKGFTWDLPRAELLESTLNQAITSKMTKQEGQLMLKFCHYMFFDYLVPKDLSDNTKRLYELFGLAQKTEKITYE